MTNNGTYQGIDIILKDASGQYLFPYTGEKYRGGAYSLFDPVIKNRILSYDESQGFAQSGTYFYKEALAGTRYGYPDAYQKILNWYNESTDLLSLKNNVTLTGTPNLDNGVISGFSTSNYAVFTSSYTTNASNSFEIQVKINSGNMLTANGRIINIYGGAESSYGLYIQYKDLCFYNGTTLLTFPAMETMEANTNYLMKWVYDGTNVKGYYSTTDESEYILYSETLAGFAPNFGQLTYSLGIRSYDAASATVWNGSIDLKQCYIKVDGAFIWNGAVVAKQHANGMQFYNIADKSTVDTIYTNTGIADMWGVDTINECIFTPRFDNLVFTSGNEYLYYIVGNTYEWTGLSSVVQQGTELLNQVSSGISAGLNTRLKVDGSNAEFPYIVEKYNSGASWYRVWSDGWCEQGGYTSSGTQNTFVTVNLLKTYANTNYHIYTSKYANNTGSNTWSININSGNITTSSFQMGTYGYLSSNWITMGYIN